MAGHDEKRGKDVLRLTGVTDNVVWIALPPWVGFPDDLKAKLRVGVNFIPDSGGTIHCYAKHLSGLVVEVIASPTAPKAEYEIAAKRLLDEAVAEHERLMQQSIQKIRGQLVELGLDPDEIIRQAREREAAEERRAAKIDELSKRLEDVK